MCLHDKSNAAGKQVKKDTFRGTVLPLPISNFYIMHWDASGNENIPVPQFRVFIPIEILLHETGKDTSKIKDILKEFLYL